MSMLSNLELIRRVPLFALLTANQPESVADAVVKRRFKRGELVVGQGDKSNTLFIILTGRVRDGREEPLASEAISVAISGSRLSSPSSRASSWSVARSSRSAWKWACRSSRAASTRPCSWPTSANTSRSPRAEVR